MEASLWNMDGQEVKLIVGALVVLMVTCLLIKRRKTSRKDEEFPRGPPAWPIIGHLPLLGAGCPHRTLADLSFKGGYGSIIGLRLGCKLAVVASDVQFAKELLLTHDKTFANRPHYQLVDSLYYGYDTAVIFSGYNPHWAKFRKIYTLELFTAKRLQQLQYIRQEEMRSLLQTFLEASCNGTQDVDVGQILADMTSSTTTRLLISKRHDEVAPELPELVRGLEHEALPTLGDYIPWLKCLDVLQKRSMKHLHDRIDKVIDSILLERRQTIKTTPSHELPHDFLQVLLSKESTSDDEEGLSTHEIKGIILDIFSGGVHTSAVTLEWAMSELLRNPSCRHKLRDEIDAVMGKGNQLVTDEDLPKLPYLESTVKEVFRLHPVVPLLVPRVSSKACKVDKYILPEGTQAFVNVWAIGRDPQLWEKADEFFPGRFDGKDIDVRGQHYELLPFGGGRRVCPGIRLGLSLVQVALANLVRAFDWELPDNQAHTSLDMSEARGISCSRAIPLRAIPKPRQLSL